MKPHHIVLPKCGSVDGTSNQRHTLRTWSSAASPDPMVVGSSK